MARSLPVLAVHAYFPEFVFQVVNMRPPDLLLGPKSSSILQYARSGRPHVIRQTLEFGFCLVGDLYVPAHEIL